MSLHRSSSVADLQLLDQLLAIVRRQLLQRLQCSLEHPDGHDVGVGVVAQALFIGIGVAVVIFVRPHDPVDLVAIRFAVVRGDAGPEPGDFDEHLRAGEAQECEAPGDHVVLPHVIGDRDVDMTLAVCAIGQLASRHRVEV